MANIFFKKGLQASYDGLTSRDNGTFYVTSDTHRLYLGNDLLSQAVAIVSALPAIDESKASEVKGTIYYVEGSNILAVYDSKNKAWTQINPDTNIASVSSEATKAADANQAIFTTEILENRGTHSNNNPYKTELKISGSNGNTVSVADGVIDIAAPELAMTENTAKTGATITLDEKTFDIIGGDNTTVTVDGTSIKVESSYVDHVVTGGSIAITPAADSGNGFAYSGNITDDKNNTYTLQGDTIDPKIAVVSKKTESATEYATGVSFVNGEAKLDVYNTTAVDKLIQEKLNEINGMTYKGLLQPNADGVATLPTSDVAIGDTWMLGATATVGTKTYQPGTIFIATGTETNGVITTDLKWDSVQTSDTDTTFTLEYLSGNQITLVPSTGGSAAGTIEFTEGDLITPTVTSTNNNLATTIQLSHKEVTTTETTATPVTQTAGASQEITVVESISHDKYGHVTEIVTKKTTVVDTITSLDSYEQVVTQEANVTGTTTGAVVTTNVKTTGDTNAKTAALTVESQSLTVTASENKVTMNLEWGTF